MTKSILNENSSWKIVLSYATIGIFYIYFSDAIVHTLIEGAAILQFVQTVKGVGFVVTTGALLFLLIRRYSKATTEMYKAMLNDERAYTALIENVGELILQIDEHYKIVRAAGDVGMVGGTCKRGLEKANLTCIVHEDDMDNIRLLFDRARSTAGVRCTGVFRPAGSSDPERWLECTVTSYLHDPAIRSLVMNARDITEQREADQKIRRSEEKFSMLFNSAPIPMWMFNIDTLKVVEVNEAALQTYGYTRQEFLAIDPRVIRPAEDVQYFEDCMDELRRVGRVTRGVHRHKKKNGEIIYVRVENSSPSSHDTKLKIAQVIDVTENVKQQRSLEEYNQRLQAAQDIANLGYWKHCVATGETSWSDNMYTLFGVVRGEFELTFPNVLSMVHPDDLGTLLADMDRVPEREGEWDLAHRIVTPAGTEKWLRGTLRKGVDEDGTPIVEGVMMDVTRQKEDEVSLEKRIRLLATLNDFTTRLLSKKEDHLEVLRSSMDKIATALKADRFFYFENYTAAGGDKCASLKLTWMKDPAQYPGDLSLLKDIPFSADQVIADRLAKGEIIETRPQTLHEGFLKQSLTGNAVRSLIMLPIIANGQFHGFIDFHDCSSEREWDADEKLFFQALSTIISTEIEKVHSERAADAARVQTESIVQNLPGITIRRLASGNWPVTFVSDELKRITGYTPEEMTNGTIKFQDILHPEDRDRVFGHIRALKPGGGFRHKFRVIGKNGDVIWLIGRGRMVKSHFDDQAYVDGVMVDVTETHRREALLRESNERFRLVLRAWHEAIIDWDIRGRKATWGEGFNTLFGYSLAENDFGLWSENIHPDDRLKVLDELRQALRDHDQRTFFSEFRFLKADRSVAYVQLRAEFIRDEKGYAERAVGALIDMTETMERVRKIAAQNDAFREIAWLQSHVIRAPLATLMGLVQLLADKEVVQVDEKELVDGIRISAAKLDAVIHSIVQRSNDV